MKTENSCEFVDLLYIVVYILDEIKCSFTEFSFTEMPITMYLFAHTGAKRVSYGRGRACLSNERGAGRRS